MNFNYFGTMITKACIDGDAGIVKFLLKTYDGNSLPEVLNIHTKSNLLCTASCCGHIKIVRFLLLNEIVYEMMKKFKRFHDKGGFKQYSPIYSAASVSCRFGHLDCAKYLISELCKFPEHNKNEDRFLLREACRGKNLKIIRYVIYKHEYSMPKLFEIMNESDIFYKLEKDMDKNIEILKVLLKITFTVRSVYYTFNSNDIVHDKFIKNACESKNLKALKFLLNYKLSQFITNFMNAPKDDHCLLQLFPYNAFTYIYEYFYSALLLSYEYGNLDLIQYLVNETSTKHPYIDACKYQKEILQSACKSNNVKVVQYAISQNTPSKTTIRELMESTDNESICNLFKQLLDQ